MGRDSEDKEESGHSTAAEDRRLFMDEWPAESSPIIDLDEEEVITPRAKTKQIDGRDSSPKVSEKKEQASTSQINDEWPAESSPTVDLDE